MAGHAHALAAMKRFAEAEQHMRTAHGLLTAAFGPGHPRITQPLAFASLLLGIKHLIRENHVIHGGGRECI